MAKAGDCVPTTTGAMDGFIDDEEGVTDGDMLVCVIVGGCVLVGMDVVNGCNDEVGLAVTVGSVVEG